MDETPESQIGMVPLSVWLVLRPPSPVRLSGGCMEVVQAETTPSGAILMKPCDGDLGPFEYVRRTEWLQDPPTIEGWYWMDTRTVVAGQLLLPVPVQVVRDGRTGAPCAVGYNLHAPGARWCPIAPPPVATDHHRIKKTWRRDKLKDARRALERSKSSEIGDDEVDGYLHDAIRLVLDVLEAEEE